MVEELKLLMQAAAQVSDTAKDALVWYLAYRMALSAMWCGLTVYVVVKSFGILRAYVLGEPHDRAIATALGVERMKLTRDDVKNAARLIRLAKAAGL